METGETQKLSYAPPGGGKKHEFPKKQFALIALFLIALAVMIEWRAICRVYFTTQAYVWQRRAMTYSPDASHVAYVEDPERARQLTNIDASYFSNSPNGGAMFAFEPIRQMQLWRECDFPDASLTRRSSASVFSHRRKPQHNQERLVMTELVAFGNEGVSGPRSIVFSAQRVIPGSVGKFWSLEDRSSWNTRNRGTIALRLGSNDRLIVYSGQTDPADESHFTIGCDLNGRALNIDGYLRDDDHVELLPREGMVETSEGIPTWKP